MTLAASADRPHWGQVAIAALAQNFASGLCFGSFGTMILAIEHEYAASRSQSSMALSLAVVSLCVTAMLVGRIIHRVDLRNLLIAGALTSAAGFGAASVASGPVQLLLSYLLLIGPGTAMLGVLPAMTLATRWVPETLRGRALGLVNMPLLVMIVPLVIAPVLTAHGVRTAFQVLALADLALVPFLLGTRNGTSNAGASQSASVPARAILSQPAFWVLSIAIGLITGAGTMKLAHFIPLLVGQGRSFGEANSLLALSGGSGLLGSVAFGYLADRIGGPRALAVNAAVQAVVWTIFLFPVSLPILTIDAILVGACGGGVQGAFGVAVAARFGPAAFGRAFSLFQLSTLPFLFAMTPIASMLFERTGSYYLPMGLTVGLLAFCAVILQLLGRHPANPENHIA